MTQQDDLSSKDASQPLRKPANPCVLVIFGIAGDLTKRLLFPALCNLGSNGLLDENFCIIGVAKEPYQDTSFREQLKKDIDEFITEPSAKKYGFLLINNIYYISGDFADPKVYMALKNKLAKLETKKANKNCLFYFAAPPQFMATIATELSKASLLVEEENYFRRMVVEKPFGHDLESAIKLNELLNSVANEKQIFRIDHFLGKETVQNLLALRFSNGLFEPIWNRLYIDHVQITVAETLGVEMRGNYYENAGALRDMVPNHLFQMLSLITMEPPTSFSADNIQAEKEKVLRAIQVFTPEQVLTQAVRGQYGPGTLGLVEVLGYRAEQNVAEKSPIETYAALKLFIDNWRWLHVPFYLRTGKRLRTHQSEIVIQFKAGPSTLFDGSGNCSDAQQKILPNLLRIFIQPEEGISLRFNAKIPGPEIELSQVNMKFKYSDYFGIKPQTGYETILYECMNGDHLLFNHADMVEAEWTLVQPILDVWGALPPRDFPNYPAGGWGPKAADELLNKDGRKMATMKSNQEIIVFPDVNHLYHFAAKDFAARVHATVKEKGIFSVVLAGGNTPKLFFDALVHENIPWHTIQFFFGDERYVPSDDPNSNYHMTYEHLFSKVPVNSDYIYKIPTEFSHPEEAAKEYERTLRQTFHLNDDAAPLFDLVYLGLGDNAHTASLMPLSELVNNYTERSHQLVASVCIAESNTYRITLTPTALNNGLEIIFLVEGVNKAPAVWQVLEGQRDPLHYPAQLIKSKHQKVLWYLDKLAAGKLNI